MESLQLDPDKLIETSERLERRIAERFEESGLRQVCAHLVQLTKTAKRSRRAILEPNLPLRWACYGLIALLLGITLTGAVVAVRAVDTISGVHWFDLVGAAEASVNELILLGAAVYFFWSFETRSKRGRVVKALHGLRKLAHLIDIHQLTKDPGIYEAPDSGTASSPERRLTPYEMGRYLDYCSEMLSLTGKVAALYGDGFEDSESIEAINGLEGLTIALQRKIWQKRMLLRGIGA